MSSSVSAPAAHMLKEKEILKGYLDENYRIQDSEYAQVNQFLGRGAFGEVYGVTMLTKNSKVQLAVKVVKFELWQEDRTKRNKEVVELADEGLTALRMGVHPNLCSVHFLELGQGLHTGEFMVFMDLCLGMDLSKYIDQESTKKSIYSKHCGQMPSYRKEILELMKQLFQGLHWMHIHGVLHLDIKPENVRIILSDSIPCLKITDFGLSMSQIPSNNNHHSITTTTSASSSSNNSSKSAIGAIPTSDSTVLEPPPPASPPASTPTITPTPPPPPLQLKPHHFRDDLGAGPYTACRGRTVTYQSPEVNNVLETIQSMGIGSLSDPPEESSKYRSILVPPSASLLGAVSLATVSTACSVQSLNSLASNTSSLLVSPCTSDLWSACLVSWELIFMGSGRPWQHNGVEGRKAYTIYADRKPGLHTATSRDVVKWFLSQPLVLNDATLLEAFAKEEAELLADEDMTSSRHRQWSGASVVWWNFKTFTDLPSIFTLPKITLGKQKLIKKLVVDNFRRCDVSQEVISLLGSGLDPVVSKRPSTAMDYLTFFDQELWKLEDELMWPDSINTDSTDAFTNTDEFSFQCESFDNILHYQSAVRPEQHSRHASFASTNNMQEISRHTSASGITISRSFTSTSSPVTGDRAVESDVADALMAISHLLLAQGQYAESEHRCKEALELLEKMPCNSSDSKVMKQRAQKLEGAKHHLVKLLSRQGDHVTAQKLSKEILQRAEALLGPNAPELATSLTRLGNVLDEQGKYSEAESVYREALRIRSEKLDKDHADVATALYNLGNALQFQAKYEESLLLHQRSLELRKTQGQQPKIAQSIARIAEIEMGYGNYAKSESLFLDSLRIAEPLLGDNHPKLARYFEGLGQTQAAQCNYTDALYNFRKSLEMRDQCLGIEHHETALSISGTAIVKMGLGEFSKASGLAEVALVISWHALGENHPQTATSVLRLGEVQLQEGKYSYAEDLLRRSVALFEQTLGTNHPESLQAQTMLYNSLYKQFYVHFRHWDFDKIYKYNTRSKKVTVIKKYPLLVVLLEEAVTGMRRVLQAFQSQFEEPHPLTAAALTTLGMCLVQFGGFEEAERVLRAAVDMYIQTLGSRHPDTARALRALGITLLRLGDLIKKKSKLVRLRQVVKKGLKIGPGYQPPRPSLLVVGDTNNPEDTYTYQGPATARGIDIVLEEAEAALTRAEEILTRSLGEGHYLTALCHVDLSLCYAIRGNITNALETSVISTFVLRATIGAHHPLFGSALLRIAHIHRLSGTQEHVEAALEYETQSGQIPYDILVPIERRVLIDKAPGSGDVSPGGSIAPQDTVLKLGPLLTIHEDLSDKEEYMDSRELRDSQYHRPRTKQKKKHSKKDKLPNQVQEQPTESLVQSNDNQPSVLETIDSYSSSEKLEGELIVQSSTSPNSASSVSGDLNLPHGSPIPTSMLKKAAVAILSASESESESKKSSDNEDNFSDEGYQMPSDRLTLFGKKSILRSSAKINVSSVFSMAGIEITRGPLKQASSKRNLSLSLNRKSINNIGNSSKNRNIISMRRHSSESMMILGGSGSGSTSSDTPKGDSPQNNRKLSKSTENNELSNIFEAITADDSLTLLDIGRPPRQPSFVSQLARVAETASSSPDSTERDSPNSCFRKANTAERRSKSFDVCVGSFGEENALNNNNTHSTDGPK